MTAPRRENRGRNAAPENRRALLAAAREVFAEQGIDAPLSAVAKRAGVGQGSLYRHFPDRIDLALAVFEDNVSELEELAARPGTTLDACLRLVTAQTIASVAFVDIVRPGTGDDRLDAVVMRVRTALDLPLRRARRTGTVRRSLRTDDVLLAISMIAAHISTTATDDRERTARACWTLLRRSFRP